MNRIHLLLLLGILIVGCETSPKSSSIFENPVCKLPCWENITPGTTKKDEALTILSKVAIINQQVVDMRHSTLKGFDDEIRFTFYRDADFVGTLYVLDNHVSVISFGDAFSKKLNVSLQQALDMWGIPQSALVIRGGEFELIAFLDPQEGFEYASRIDAGTTRITPETTISEVAFFDPRQYQQVLNSGLLSSYTLSADETLSRLRPWNGYGVLSQYEK